MVSITKAVMKINFILWRIQPAITYNEFVGNNKNASDHRHSFKFYLPAMIGQCVFWSFFSSSFRLFSCFCLAMWWQTGHSRAESENRLCYISSGSFVERRVLVFIHIFPYIYRMQIQRTGVNIDLLATAQTETHSHQECNAPTKQIFSCK